MEASEDGGGRSRMRKLRQEGAAARPCAGADRKRTVTEGGGSNGAARWV